MQGLALNNNNSSVVDGQNYIRSRLERLLFIPEGEILGNPDYGSRLYEFFHEPLDDTSADDIINEIVFLMQEREPEIELEDISVNILNDDSGSSGIIISMTVYNVVDQESEIIEFFKIIEV
jgi:phage baseplate assembly protein W